MEDRKPGPADPAPERVAIARRARRIIESEYDDDRCDTRTIARRLGVTRPRLCHAYRDTYGSTIGRDVRRRRIRAACRMLEARPGELIKKVAGEVGFGRRSYRTFLNSFRREMGMPPRRYQRLAAMGRLDGASPKAGDPERRRWAGAED